MALLCSSLLVSIILHVIAAQASDDAGTFRVAVEGEEVDLSCPSDVIYWQFFQHRFYNVVDSFLNESMNVSLRYLCTGLFNTNGSCCQGIRLDVEDEFLLVIDNISVDYAGKYTCSYQPPDQSIHEKTINLTIIRNSSKLNYAIDQTSTSLNVNVTNATILPAGTNLSLSCVFTYAGFIDPGGQLIVRNNTGGEQVLQSRPRRMQAEFMNETESKIVAEYVVKNDDDVIDVQCIILTQNSAGRLPVASKRFRGPRPELPPEPLSIDDVVGKRFSSNEIIITIVLLVAVFVTISVAVIVVIRQKNRKRRQAYNDESQLLTELTSDLEIQPVGRLSFGNSRLRILPPLESVYHETTTPL